MTTQASSVAVLGQQIYDLAIVLREDENLTDPNGEPISWLLDVRVPMHHGDLARQVGEILARRVRAAGVHQVVGAGFGAYSMVSATTMAPGYPAVRGGFVRSAPKSYGRRRLVEGAVQRDNPVIILDDILNSGLSAMKTLRLLQDDEFRVAGYISIFEFTWNDGRKRLEREGLWVDSILALNPGTDSSTSSDSA